MSYVPKTKTDADYVNTSGDTMTGILQAGGGIYVQSQQRFLNGTGGHRWQLYTYGSETGGNAGSDLVLGNLDDSGGYLSNAMYLYRNSGAVFIPNLIASAGSSIVIATGWSVEQNWCYRHAGMATISFGAYRTSALNITGQPQVATIPTGFRPPTGAYPGGAAMLMVAGKWTAALIVAYPDGRLLLSHDAATNAMATSDYLYGILTYPQGN